MKFIAHFFAALFDLLIWPFTGMAPIVAMLVISGLTGILMLLVYKVTSNQPKIKAVKRRIKGNFLAIALYKDSLAVLLSSALRIFASNLRYFQLNLRPLLFMIVPIGVLLINIDAWYGYRPIAVGEPAIVSVKVEPRVNLYQARVDLKVPAGVTVQTPPLRIPAEAALSWRIVADTPGHHTLDVVINDARYAKTLVVGETLARLSPLRYKAGFWNKLLYPTQAIIAADAPLSQIEIRYPPTELSVFGWEMHWIWAYFVLSILFAFPLRGVFRVEI